ncbi:MAG: GTPase HflX [Planctomycetaceae bacterium]|jgi:GTP-binding protein HflX|nr:GTPase HflX [Planctomycetaceae bacterium]
MESSPFESLEISDVSMQIDRMTRVESVVSERAILVIVTLSGEKRDYDEPATPEHQNNAAFDELKGLAEAANAVVVGQLSQRRNMPDKTTYLGYGKVEELKQMIASLDADLVIFDANLNPGQTRNLEKALKTKVIDRTELILDIFSTRAQTHEARLAVELAQLEYSLPRLKQMWTHLERQRGTGTQRGAGEKQLEVDRRLAQKRIAELKILLAEIHGRKRREVAGRGGTRAACLVGYTNAGKSTVLNALTNSDVFAKDLLFATLDTRTRRWRLPGWGPVLLSDTVGFIRNLPHDLIASFRATLEEATQADVLIHIADASHAEVMEQITSAYRVLEEIGIEQKDTILVLNKIDALESSPEKLERALSHYPQAIPISAKTGEGLDRLAAAVSDALSREFLVLDVDMPVSNGRLAAYLAEEGEVLSRNYENDRAVFRCRVPRYVLGRLQKESDVRAKEKTRDTR